MRGRAALAFVVLIGFGFFCMLLVRLLAERVQDIL